MAINKLYCSDDESFYEHYLQEIYVQYQLGLWPVVAAAADGDSVMLPNNTEVREPAVANKLKITV